jgi:succinate dehydrogenase/fumarate reductase flavoprotein subunit
MSIGTGWIAGRSAIEDLESLPPASLDAAEVRALYNDVFSERSDGAKAESDRILRDLQAVMFAYDVSVWKSEERLRGALGRIRVLQADAATIAAPHVHELVRLKETEAMLLAAQVILEASLLRTESRLSHFREDFDVRDDERWLRWIDAHDEAGTPVLTTTPIPTPLCAVAVDPNVSVTRVLKGAAR